ncbi:MAG TPA: efflux RND transporter periplasmic adaptor subunit [Kofleriaceae bacterium]|nr:efflux RND transporter periplasmic adaptor subunit [Kofleriaceae bacterium]
MIAVAMALAVPGCKSEPAKGGKGMQSGDKDAPVPVETVILARGAIEDTLRFSATIRAEIHIKVLARSLGQVQKRTAEEGDQVAANDILVRVEGSEQSSAITRIDNDLATARTNYERQRKLRGSGVVSDEALENAKFEVDRLVIARRDATRSLGYTIVRAPISGTVTQRFIEYGDLIAPNQPLYEIVDFDSLVAEVFVPEKDIHRVRVGGRARLAAPSSGKPLPDGVVERIAPIVDPRSGTVKVTLDLPDATGYRPGMFVDVHLVVASDDDALLLPRRALVYDNDEPYAFRLVGADRVERVRVVVEVSDREVIKPAEGFAAGDRVVVAGQVGLKDGAVVEAIAAPVADRAQP